MQESTPSHIVQAWEEQVLIPTYGIGAPDKNPMFLEKRVYQGSSGVVYPHPVIDRVTDEKADKTYTALFLENRYLKIMVLPELGGRVQMALDKTNGYHFIYYNRVIKPALVGLAGPWISGGIEFNWPQHHRPSTFDPVDYRIDSCEDGSKTVWCSEIERMFRTRGAVGFRLYPDRAYLELDVRLYNRTGEPQTFLWWANPAVSVNDDCQSVFPPDVHAVMDHGRRDVSDFPIATGTYYKVDYSPGTDISRYKNVPVPTSYMADHSDFDFLGCYDHGVEAGMMHVANHHVVPGKKQWTWGCGDFGKAWDRQLTDEDGPYIELMGGAYTDNQPDFSWIMPGEEKRFTQVFMPYKLIGPPKNASREAVINLEVDGAAAEIGVYVSAPRTAFVRLLREGVAVFSEQLGLSPETAFRKAVSLPEGTRPQQLTLQVLEEDRILTEYTPLLDDRPEIPDPATAAPPPASVGSNEELYLHGLHLEQYRHATYLPEPYYEEALRRDPGDSLCNNAMGLLLYRRGRFAQAEAYFRRAVERLTLRNPNPRQGEPFYNLGVALKMQGRFQEAYEAFYKATWNDAWKGAALFELGRIASRRGDYEEALDLADHALVVNTYHHQARHLKAALLRRQGRVDDALATTQQSLAENGLDFGAHFERKMMLGDTAFDRLIRGYVHNYIELALDYAHAGLFDTADAVLREAPGEDPMVFYYLGWGALQRGDAAEAAANFRLAAARPPDYCFPHRIECVPALEAAIAHAPSDARAPYYLGNFWYAHRQYDKAIAAWERSCDLDPDFPTVHRNLGLAYMNKRQDADRARIAYETAFELDPSDARVLFELDQLYKQVGVAAADRLALLNRHDHLVDLRDDLSTERIALLNLLGRHEEALGYLTNRTFHPWEGGEGKVTGQYVASLVGLARTALENGDSDSAIEFLDRARCYPDNLGEGKVYGTLENQIFFHFGEAYDANGQTEQARSSFEQAADGCLELTSARYYNDQPPDAIFYQGLARRKLGHDAEAEATFQRLVDFGEQHLGEQAQIDYFAVSLPDFLVFEQDLDRRHETQCRYVAGLGYLGLGLEEEARAHLAQARALDPFHLGAAVHHSFLTPASTSDLLISERADPE